MAMNGKADNAKPLRCNYFRIRSSSKIVFLACALGILLLLNACATYVPLPPERIPDLAYLDTGQNAYLWTSGLSADIYFFNKDDYATITQINDVFIPAKYIPQASGGQGNSSTLLEIPAGKHIVEIVFKEYSIARSYIADLIFMYLEQSRQTLTFIAEPNRTYTPFVTDQCSRDWFWIEDWGPYVAGQETIHSFMDDNIFFRRIQSDYTKPVVAGEAPNKNECKENSNVNKENSNVNKGQQSPP